jgi:hypothetical protein
VHAAYTNGHPQTRHDKLWMVRVGTNTAFGVAVVGMLVRSSSFGAFLITQLCEFDAVKEGKEGEEGKNKKNE